MGQARDEGGDGGAADDVEGVGVVAGGQRGGVAGGHTPEARAGLLYARLDALTDRLLVSRRPEKTPVEDISP